MMLVNRSRRWWRGRLLPLVKACAAIFGVLHVVSLMHVNRPRDTNKRPSVSTSRLWSNAIRGVLDCRTGNVTRRMRIARSLAEVEAGYEGHAVDATSRETSMQRGRAFNRIYSKNLWPGQARLEAGSDGVSGSGPGSTLQNTVNIRKTLDTVISQVKTILGKPVITILDIPCGDLTWMSGFIANRTDVIYTGMDIVTKLITHHRHFYTAKYPHMTFINGDIVTNPLRHKYDVILTREMTIHLTTQDTFKVLNNFKTSGSHFLLATTIPTVGNIELDLKVPGRHRLQNLEAEPINLPPPLCISRDHGIAYNALWVLNL